MDKVGNKNIVVVLNNILDQDICIVLNVVIFEIVVFIVKKDMFRVNVLEDILVFSMDFVQGMDEVDV